MDAVAGLIDRLAGLLDYPQRGFETALADCLSSVPATDPEIGGELERFAAAVGHLSLSQLQQVYTETFDLSGSCALDIGWHLFGDRLERGGFLADLRSELRAAGIDEGEELPDYLPHVLMLIARVTPARAEELRRTIRPAVDALARALRARGSAYEHLLKSACAAACQGR
jgi:nitrate reductase delta subunit